MGTQVENQAFVLFDAVDVVVGGGFVVAEEVVGLDDCLALFLGLDLLCQGLFLASREDVSEQE